MVHLHAAFETNGTLRSIWRFLVVGMLGTLIDIVLFTGLHAWLSVPALVANTLSYSVGIVNNFVLHRHWTFADRAHQTPVPPPGQGLRPTPGSDELTQASQGSPSEQDANLLNQFAMALGTLQIPLTQVRRDIVAIAV